MAKFNKKQVPPEDGKVRQSQMLTSYGPGSLVDLTDRAVIMGGLDLWNYDRTRGPTIIEEPRLIDWLTRQDERFATVRLQEPPGDHNQELSNGAYVTAIEFPRWYVVQKHQDLPGGGRARRIVHRNELEKGKFWDDGKKRNVVPVRFVRACPHGHIDDINWKYFCHSGKTTCGSELWFEERGTSGDIAAITVACKSCGARRSMATALEQQGYPLGYCNGRRPWLGPDADEECLNAEDKPMRSRLLVRTASHSYFAQLVSVISIPEEEDDAKAVVDAHWQETFRAVENRVTFDAFCTLPKIAYALEGLDRDAVFAEIMRRKQPSEPKEEDEEYVGLKRAELDVFMAQPYETGQQPNMEATFFARRARIGQQDAGAIMSLVDRVVLVHRLREVCALVGFTRFEPVSPDVDGELDLGVSKADIAQKLEWLPAVENNGEGIFIALDMDAIRAWESKPAVKARIEQLERAFDKWKVQRESTREMPFPGGRYVMLHSLSHLLLTAVALECGYSASSIKERIYATEHACGLMLYTGSPDAEGTLGGLVEVGRRIEEHLITAIRLGRLCSNDPVCAEHDPADEYQNRLRHGAACHGCLLISETSCEQRNEYLDRSLVVPTISCAGAAFFAGVEV